MINTLSSFALSLFLAVIIWVVAINTSNPLEIRRNFPSAGVEVMVVEVGSGLVVVRGEKQRVNLDVRAPRESWFQLEPDDFRAWVDLEGLGPGTHQVKVNVEQLPPVNSNTRILRIAPDHVAVEIDEMVTKTLPVQVEILDRASVPFSYQVLTPTVEPTQVDIVGPRQVLARLERAEVAMEVLGSRSPVSLERTVLLVARDGARMDVRSGNVRANPEMVTVTVPIQQRQGYRELIVNPVIVGEPAAGYWMSNRRVDPATVSVVGLPSAIEALPSIVKTEPIDISGERAGTIIRSARLQLPENVSPVSERAVSVTVEIEPWLSSTAITLTVEPTGLDPGLEVSEISPDHLNVLIEGPRVELESITAAEVLASVDLTDLGVGTHLVTPNIRAPGSLEAKSWLPDQVEITIQEAQAEQVITETVHLAGVNGSLRAVVSPPTVTLNLVGSALALQALSPGQVTATIDLSGRGPGTYTLVPTVTLPATITTTQLVPSQFTIDLFSPLNVFVITRTLAWENLGQNLVLDLQPRVLTLTLRGPGSTETAQRNAALRALVDLQGLEAGRYTIQPEIGLPPGYELVGVLPSTVEARLSRR